MKDYEKLFTSLDKSKIKGLNEQTIKKLNKLDIYTIYDLFYYFPKSYENSAIYTNINMTKDNQSVILKGKITYITKKYLPGNRLMVNAIFNDGSDDIELIWFNNRFVYSNISKNENIVISGKVKFVYKRQMVNPSYKKVVTKDDLNTISQLEPKYSLTSGLKQEKLRNLIKNAIDMYGDYLEENMPIDFVYDNKIMSRKKSIVNIHFPENSIALDFAIRRFTYEEIMILEMGILEKKFLLSNENIGKYSFNDNKELVKEYIASLPFELTSAQKKVVATIYGEFKQGKVISRLIQGDVGSGKTVVVFILMLYIVSNNGQCAMMAPTEILARQHYNNIVENFSKLGVKIKLLTSSTKIKEKKQIQSELKEGKIDILIGTHSVIEKDIEFKNLSLCVIDEQHKFGVNQRNMLRQKANIPNIIVMSATPIPRSLALTIYGDLDVSVIDNLPSGRKPIKTKWVKNDYEKKKMYEFIKKKLEKKQQVYIVSPLIEESDKINMVSVNETFNLISKIFYNHNIAILHGKQKNDEKNKIMNDFKNGDIDILISTTVVEVGVDVSNANIMIIRNAEKFGLSTLHQLRGRVGRGNDFGYCFLESDTDNEISKKRLEIMETQIDGFVIANEDLKLRNTGQIYGVRQSGISDLVLLDIVKNIKEIEIVKDFVHKYLQEHNGKIENEYLKIDIKKKEGVE